MPRGAGRALPLSRDGCKGMGSDVHGMLALRRSSREVVVADEELNGTDMVRELLGTLLLDSGVLADQQLHERTQQRFASLADVVHKLEETQVEREFLLGDAPMRAKPTP
jgi:hypothetical protein